MRQIFDSIKAANPGRRIDNADRRIFKLVEEYGEIAEAYLNRTSAHNHKAKSWDDIREEVADGLIVAVDVALTPTPDFEGTIGGLLTRVAHLTPPGVEEQQPRPDPYIAACMATLKALCATHDALVAAEAGDAPWAGFVQQAGEVVRCAARIALAPLPDQIGHTPGEMAEVLRVEVTRKLQKWQGLLAAQAARSTAEDAA